MYKKMFANRFTLNSDDISMVFSQLDSVALKWSKNQLWQVERLDDLLKGGDKTDEHLSLDYHLL